MKSGSSLVTRTSITTLPSGVICGVTSSDREASRKEMEYAGGFLVSRDHLGLGDDLAIAALLHGAELQIQQNVAAQQAHAEPGSGPFNPKVDEQVTTQATVHPIQRAAPSHTQALLVIDTGFYDTRLDHDLAYRHIQLRYQPSQIGKSFARLGNHQRVGPCIHTEAAAPSQDAVIGQARKQQFRQLGGFCMKDRDQLSSQRLQQHLLAHAPGLPGQLSNGSDQQHVALLAPAQPLAAQHKVKCLGPRHVFQVQGYSPLHRIAGDQVDAGVLRHDLKH
ncbi:hypothetical protein WR25_21600 [Diploscapter pachys]|uniref:Uncharacterized protein n=1 Tax=Diploscapter pachys TaxID=2018661 RepID=A0A2A2KB02_9BILA|nr:hypothetical protein WR25_21600 [Diploscapter pachys]